MIQGARNRCRSLSDSTLSLNHKPYMHLLPLIDVIAYAANCKNVNSNKILKLYFDCLTVFETEIQLWISKDEIIQELLDNKMPNEIIKHIIAVKNGRLSFEPAGYDGCYGRLKIQLESNNEC